MFTGEFKSVLIDLVVVFFNKKMIITIIPYVRSHGYGTCFYFSFPFPRRKDVLLCIKIIRYMLNEIQEPLKKNQRAVWLLLP